MTNAATVTVTAALLSARCIYFNCNIYADALQSTSSFPQPPRRHTIAMAQPYFTEGHPFSYDPTNFDLGSSAVTSEQLYMDGSKGMDKSAQAHITAGKVNEAETANNHGFRYNFDSSAQMEVPEFVPGRQRRNTLRRRGKLAPHQLGASILPSRRKRRTSGTISSSDLLTFDEEKEIAEDIRRFRSVTRTRDTLTDWMSREMNTERGGYQHGVSPDYQLASSCSLSVEQLHDVMARGQEARTRLVQGNVGLVTMIAKRYHAMLKGGVGPSSGGGAGGTDATLKLDDLIQEGYMGIMEAAERFDPTKGCRFSTYATHWIRQRIVRSIAEGARMIRLPVHVQTIIRNMHKKNKELEAQIGRCPSTPELAHEMGVPLDKIQAYQHLTKNVLSLELPVDRHANAEDKRTLGDRVACTEMPTPDEDFMSEALRGEVHNMLHALSHNERMVLTHRFGLEDGRPKSLRETAERMGVSSDIVRTAEARALNKLRQPRMNYRLKDYIGGLEAFGELDCAEPHQGGTPNDTMEEQVEDQQQHYYNYPHHTYAESLNTNYHVGGDDLRECDRPTPESIWSF